MELRHIEVFVEVAKTKSFTKAAENLGLSQPTVSLHLQNLERELGVKLIDREGRNISLTPAGKLFFEYAAEIVSLKERALLALKRFLGSVEGTFVIGASTVPGEFILPRILPEFMKQYPKTKFKIRVMDSEMVIQSVAEGDMEMGVVGAKGEEEKLIFRPLCRDRVVVVAPNSDKYPDRVDMNGLAELPFVMREKGSGTRRAFERALEGYGMKVEDLNVVAEVGSTTAVKEAVRSGLGCGIISELSVRSDLEKGDLKIVDVEGLEILRDFFVVLRKGKTLSPAIELFVDFLMKEKGGKSCNG